MVIPYTHEDKFHNGELEVGLSFNGQEISGSNYKRIPLRSANFRKIGDHYENTREFGFSESFDEWGHVNSCLCFYGNDIVGFGDAEKPRYVSRQTTVMFEKGNFKIWFNE